jgi:hypothetical protein
MAEGNYCAEYTAIRGQPIIVKGSEDELQRSVFHLITICKIYNLKSSTKKKYDWGTLVPKINVENAVAGG